MPKLIIFFLEVNIARSSDNKSYCTAYQLLPLSSDPGLSIVALIILFCTINQQLISLKISSEALLSPICTSTPIRRTRQSSHRETISDLEHCPKRFCIMKRKNPNSTFISCDECCQSFHIRCAGLSRKEIFKEDFKYICEKCNN